MTISGLRGREALGVCGPGYSLLITNRVALLILRLSRVASTRGWVTPQLAPPRGRERFLEDAVSESVPWEST